MSIGKFEEIFERYKETPILTPKDWSYKVGSVFNPGAIKFNNEILLLVRVKDRENCSHFTIARSKDGKTSWQIDPEPTLVADKNFDETFPGVEDPRVVWFEERNEFIITCVSFYDDAASISLITTPDFSEFNHLDRPMISGNKDASLFSERIGGYYALMHRPTIEGRDDIWVSFSKDLIFWGKHRKLLPTRHRRWDSARVGLGPQPIKTPDGWLIIYHGSEDTASGTIYRVCLALLDLETLEVIRRSRDWVFGPEKDYERVGNVGDIVFPCGAVIDEKTNELSIYYGAADTAVALATADLDDILEYLKKCTEY